MAITETHNHFVFQPPPGTRFTIWGSNLHLEFERGKEDEVAAYVLRWLQEQIIPTIPAAVAQHAQILRKKQEATARAASRNTTPMGVTISTAVVKETGLPPVNPDLRAELNRNAQGALNAMKVQQGTTLAVVPMFPGDGSADRANAFTEADKTRALEDMYNTFPHLRPGYTAPNANNSGESVMMTETKEETHG